MSENLLRWNESRARYEWHGNYDSKHLVDKTGAEFRWDPKRKKWWTQIEERAAKLSGYADDATVERLSGVIKKNEQSYKSSRAVDANIDVPRPHDLEYLPFQRAGIAYALAHERCLIGDEMGLGKTVEALGVLNAQHTHTHDQMVLVICPASLKINWAREAAKWLVGDWEITVVNAKDPFPRMPTGTCPHVVIVNYDILNRFEDQIRSITWDVVIVDECHYLKNEKTRRTKQVFGFTSKKEEIAPIEAGRWLFLSGTPMASRPSELINFIRFCAPQAWPGWKKFVTRYCAAFQQSIPTKGGGRKLVWDTSGNSNLEELQELCRSHFLVRRLKKDVLTELPPKRRQVVELPLNGAATAVRKENKAWAAHQVALEELRAAVELAKASEVEEEYRVALVALRQGVAVAFQDLSRARKDTAIAKVPWVIQRVEDALAEGPVVLFGWHKDVLKIVRDKLGGGLITGDTPLKKRQQHVDDFQAGRIDLISGTMGAMGVGITLTRSTLAIFCELDWVPANVSQSEDRIHRHGQKQSVLIQHLVLPDSLDARLAATLVEKQEVLEAGLDTQSEFIGIEQLPVIPGIEEPATGNVTRDHLEEEGVKLSPGQVAAIHNGLQLLASVCDGAESEDGCGFNKIDTRVGKSLALCPHLSHKQAALGQKIITKYQRQLTDEILDGARIIRKGAA